MDESKDPVTGKPRIRIKSSHVPTNPVTEKTPKPRVKDTGRKTASGKPIVKPVQSDTKKKNSTKASASDYTQFVELEYDGKTYLFNPNIFGVGFWGEKTKSGKIGKYADDKTQKILNKLAFGRDNLPNMIQRFKESSNLERQRLKKISAGWLQLKIKGIKQNIKGIPKTLSSSSINNRYAGQLFFYVYDAKLAKELPYWDKFPLVLILDIYPDGFLGLNFHYLRPDMRATLLSALLKEMKYDAVRDVISVGVNYQILAANIKKYKGFQPCLKRYLSNHIKSNILPIEPHEWNFVIHLPIEQFQKKSSSYVWKDSVSKL